MQAQQRHLAALVTHARRAVPMYREMYAECGELPSDAIDFDSFARLPLATKPQLKASFPDRLTADGVDLSDLYPIATSGTSDRVMLFQDEVKRDWDRAADLLQAVEGTGFRPGHRQAIIPPDVCYERCGADEHGRTESAGAYLRGVIRGHGNDRRIAARKALSLAIRDYVWRIRMMKSFGVDGTATHAEALDNYLEDIRHWRPRVLAALPMFLYVLARRNRSLSGPVQIPVLRPSAGKITPHMMQAIEAAFGGTVRENYGTAELGTIAFDCAHGRQQHLLSELFYIEFIRNGAPVAPGELGEMVVTDLRNRVAPLIRYTVGDVGRFQSEPCPCGRTGLRFTVHGRIDETVVLADGRALAPDELIDFFLMRDGIAYAKVFQRSPDRFLVEYVHESEVSTPLNAAAIQSAFCDWLGQPVVLRLRPVRRIAPEPSGKYRLVESCTYDQFHRTSQAGVGPRNQSARPVAVSG